MFKIRVQTIDGDTDYIDIKSPFAYVNALGKLSIDRCRVASDLYPEYRPQDIEVAFVEVI